LIPLSVSVFLSAQLGISGDTLVGYAMRRRTRQQHMKVLRRIYAFRMSPG